MANLKVNIAGVEFKNPVIPASGAFGFGREYECLYPIKKLGGISCKGMTLNKKDGNEPSRVAETKGGMLNSVGLQNPGVDYFIKNELPYLADKETVIIANVAGSTVEDCIEIARRLNETNVHMLELNISCPNVKEGGVAFGTDPNMAFEVTNSVRKATSKPLMVKLSPNVTDITVIAKACENAGADSISLINTLLGMRININTKRPYLHNNVGGLSGECIFPIALRMVWQVANAVKVPVVGMGGISSANDAIEMMLAGASAVQIGAAIFNDPYTPIKVIDGINEYLDNNNISDINQIIGALIPY